MAIEHSTLPDAQLHELKGVAGASSGQVPVANGSGHTVWTSPSIVAGQMSLVANGTATLIAAAGDATLGTAGDYIKATANLVGSGLNNMTFSSDKLVASIAGLYAYRLDASVTTAGASYTALRVGVAGVVGGNKIVATTPAGEVIPMSLNGLVVLSIGDTIDIRVANTVGNVTIKDGNLSLIRVGFL